MHIKSIAFIILNAVFIMSSYAQSIKEFAEDAKVVYQGDTVLIKAEYATIFSREITDKLDNNRLVYDSLRKSYKKLMVENKKLIKALKSSQSKIKALIVNSDLGSSQLDKLAEEIGNLTEISEDMEETNQDFEETNIKFKVEIEDLKEQNKTLKKQIRKVRWQAIKGYIISGLTGIAVGIGIFAAAS